MPVVSGADVHKLEGIVRLRDGLNSYGLSIQATVLSREVC